MAAATPKVQTHGTVRISLPASVAYNPDSLKKTIGGLMERIGCRTCFSGADCFFTAERNFAVDPAGGISASFDPAHAAPGVRFEPVPLPWSPSTVVASLSSGIRFDIEKVFQAVDRTISLIGSCSPCHSGFDVFYLNEVEVIGVNNQLQAQKFGGAAQGGA